MKKLLLSLLTALFVTLTGHAQDRVPAPGDDSAEAEIVFQIIENMPCFPGGLPLLAPFLAANLQYPEEARKAKVQGTVFVAFVVEKTGSIRDVQVLKGIGYGCNEEAERVIKLMPAWTPGTQGGKPVAVRYAVPVRFIL